MRVLSAVAVAVLLSAPAYAQMPNINLMPEVESKTQDEKDQDAGQPEGLQGTRSARFRTPRRRPILGAVRSDAPKAIRQSRQAEDQDRSSTRPQARAAQPVALAVRAASPVSRRLGSPPPPALYRRRVSSVGPELRQWCFARAISPAGWPRRRKVG